LCGLLYDVTGAEVARIERLAASKALVLPMVEADAVFAQSPAEINLLIIN
jgi:hypothetical protein